jgi:cytidylate kinase
MKIDLKKYMNQRDQLRAQKKDPGPLVTISRQYGCEANDVTIKLLTRINRHLETQSVNAKPWRYISKEIIEDASKELKLPLERLEKRVLQHQDKSGVMNQVFASLSTSRNLSDREIIQKVNEIIQTYAHDGRVIIVGRGGNALTRNIERSLHFRIFAPLEWRVEYVANKYQLSRMEAEEQVRVNDEERIKWVEHLTAKPYDHCRFDLLLNRSTLNANEMVDTIFTLMRQRHLI